MAIGIKGSKLELKTERDEAEMDRKLQKEI